MTFGRKIVLHTPGGVPANIDELARQFVADGVAFVGAVGKDCAKVEDIIDWVAVEHGSPEQNFILTSSHEGESLEDAIEFASSLSGEYEGEVQVVEA